MMAMAVTLINAEPAPWITLAVISIGILMLSPDSRDVIVKMYNPTLKNFTLPQISDALLMGSKTIALARRKEFVIQDNVVALHSKCCCMSGSPMFTADSMKGFINDANMVVIKIGQRSISLF